MARYFLFICLTCFSHLLPASSTQQIIQESLKDVKLYIDKKFEEAAVQTYPFPHLLIENILPPHLYDKVDLYWPNKGDFVGKDRSILAITYGSLEDTKLSKEQKVFWRIFGEVIVDRYIKQNIIRKLAPHFNLKWGMQDFDEQDIVQIENFHQLRQNCLINDSHKYQIRPHVDQLNLFAAMLLYLPQDHTHQTFGTTFYDGPHADDPNLIYCPNPDQLKEVKTIPYHPNTLVAFLQTPFSWHSVKPDANHDANYVRRMYAAPIFLSPEFMEKHYSGIYNRQPSEDYYFDHRFLCQKNWHNIWGSEDAYR